MSELLSHLARWRPFNAVVIGDYMLDELVYGAAERLSPDAPVPVLQVQRCENKPGGAANVCLDLAAIKGRITALGVTGDDQTGRALREALNAEGVDASALIADPSRPTTVKRSLVGLAQHRHPQKMFRLDMESTAPISQEVIEQLLSRFDAALADADVVCIEDYGKGVCQPAFCREVLARCRARGVPALVDPARLDDYDRYRGATAVTPNRSEAELAAESLSLGGDLSPESIASAMREQLDLDAVVLTLDRDGALLCVRGEAPVRVPTVAREVYDVTGAGDMVLAALAGALANGIGWADAVRFANAAAGLEVEIFGVEPIPLERIHHSVLLSEGRLRGKLRTLDEIRIEVAALRRDGRTIVFTNGCFDILHAGHIALLRSAAAHGDALIVGINDDESVRRLKGPDRPVNHQEDRVEVLSELESVTAVALFSDDTPLELIRAIRPDVLVKGADYTKDEVVGGELVESWGGRVELAPILDGRSTTGAIERLRDR